MLTIIKLEISRTGELMGVSKLIFLIICVDSQQSKFSVLVD